MTVGAEAILWESDKAEEFDIWCHPTSGVCQGLLPSKVILIWKAAQAMKGK